MRDSEKGRKRTGENDRGFVTPKPITKCRDESHTSGGGCELISTFERKREEEKKGGVAAKECFCGGRVKTHIFVQGHWESQAWAQSTSTL